MVESIYSELNEKTVFVAGATGLAGASVVRALLRASPGVRVIGAARSISGALVDDPRVEYRAADLRDRDACRQAVEGGDWAVICAAAAGGAAQAQDEPWKQVADNVALGSYLFEALHNAGVKRTIFVGSASVYQELDGFIREDELDLNTDPHPSYLGVGWAMRYLEKQGGFWHQSTGMELISVRLANIYGPFAKFDPRVSNFVAAFIRKAVDKMDPLDVWGSLDVVRDIIYVDDFADAVLKMLVRRDIVYDVFNIGSERKTTLDEVLNIVLDCAGHEPREIRMLGDRPTTISFRALDCHKAHSVLGWSPSVELHEGLRRTVDWWGNNKDSWDR